MSFSLQYFQEKRPFSTSTHKPETCETLKQVQDDETLIMEQMTHSSQMEESIYTHLYR